MVKECLIVIANPKLIYRHGAGIGSILSTKAFSDKHGAVFWDFTTQIRKNKIKVLYFYDVSKKMITHRADIIKIFYDDIPKKEKKYFPDYRKPYFSKKGWSAIKIKNVQELIKHLSPKNFGVKIGPGNFRYGIDINPKTKKTKSDFEKLSDDHIFNCLINRRFREDDIENMLFDLGLIKNKNIQKEKLPHDKKFDRYDIFYINSKNQPVVIEIKKDIADKKTLHQLKEYMKSLQKKERKTVHGIILSKNATPELERLVKKEKYIKIQKYKFSIDFGDLMKD